MNRRGRKEPVEVTVRNLACPLCPIRLLVNTAKNHQINQWDES
jgi:hypothetical protein